MAKKKVREYHGKRLIINHAKRVSDGKVAFDRVNTVLVDSNTDWDALFRQVRGI